MADIEIKSIQKTFGEILALKDINLTVKSGEFLTLVGPSGCGKSTLLRIIAGLERQSGGDVLINGDSVNTLRPSKRNLAMVFQSYALYPHLTILENMLTPLKLRDLTFLERFPLWGSCLPSKRVKMKEMEELAFDTAKVLRLDHLLNRKPGQLSGGQRQRVALGRAMVREPNAFLMDEPLSNLDAALRVHMRAELSELHRTLGTTFIYVTHDQAEALTMSDRLAVMMDGEIIQVGTPNDIYRNPRDRRVAEFIGSPQINFLSGEVDDGGNVSMMGSSTGIRIDKNIRKVQVGIRPEHLFLVNGSGDSNGMPMVVTHKENLGSDYFLHGLLNGSKSRVITRAKPEEVMTINVGSTVKIKPRPGATLVFGENNLRIDNALAH